MTDQEEHGNPPLYVWLGGDPQAVPFDTAIEDVPGVSDLQLVAEAIRAGKLGTILPPRIAVSPHATPGSGGFRSIDVSRLLTDYKIRFRRRFEVLLADADGSDS